ncbi:MAG: LLM class flavin-dependent oxidoreductase [Deltaproteobacteria bacterium]|nr:LLM class flavin-dependent oxidoreductase [Deltaproteobacteria bacterium]
MRRYHGHCTRVAQPNRFRFRKTWFSNGLRVDRGPFSSVVVTDRVVSAALEPLVVLAVTGGATRRIRLMTSVVIGPAQRNWTSLTDWRKPRSD